MTESDEIFLIRLNLKLIFSEDREKFVKRNIKNPNLPEMKENPLKLELAGYDVLTTKELKNKEFKKDLVNRSVESEEKVEQVVDISEQLILIGEEDFQIFYSGAGSSFRRNSEYWTALIQLTYFLMYYVGLPPSCVKKLSFRDLGALPYIFELSEEVAKKLKDLSASLRSLVVNMKTRESREGDYEVMILQFTDDFYYRSLSKALQLKNKELGTKYTMKSFYLSKGIDMSISNIENLKEHWLRQRKP